MLHRSAEVVIVLRNRGIESYKHAEYGNTIFIHRIIRDDGTTAYKIKGTSGTQAIQYTCVHLHIGDSRSVLYSSCTYIYMWIASKYPF